MQVHGDVVPRWFHVAQYGDGAADAVDRLRSAGAEVLFVTNMSRLTEAEQEAKLATNGIDATGAVHAAAAFDRNGELQLAREDIGRHNAVDKIAGWMLSEGVGPEGKLLYTTGRLTSEMVIKTALMGLPVLVSRSGFTAWGVEIAQEVGLTLIGRMRGKRFICLSGEERITRDADIAAAPDEDRKHRRKGAPA